MCLYFSVLLGHISMLKCHRLSYLSDIGVSWLGRGFFWLDDFNICTALQYNFHQYHNIPYIVSDEGANLLWLDIMCPSGWTWYYKKYSRGSFFFRLLSTRMLKEEVWKLFSFFTDYLKGHGRRKACNCFFPLNCLTVSLITERPSLFSHAFACCVGCRQSRTALKLSDSFNLSFFLFRKIHLIHAESLYFKLYIPLCKF